MNPLLILEQSVLAEGREWTRQRLETQAQKEANQWGAICPESGLLLKYRKKQRLTIMSCAGVIVLKTTRGFSTALGRWINPARQRWALKPRQRMSPELQSRLAFNATRPVPTRRPPPPPRAGARPSATTRCMRWCSDWESLRVPWCCRGPRSRPPSPNSPS